MWNSLRKQLIFCEATYSCELMSDVWVVLHHQYGVSVSFLRRHFAEKPVVALPNVGCSLRLHVQCGPILFGHK